MQWLQNWFSSGSGSSRRRGGKNRLAGLAIESLEERKVMSADPLPVLMVLADQQDFYYREYNETRIALEAKGLSVVVAATTTNPTFPHPGSGQLDPALSVTPNIALGDVDPANYSAIAFVGGWGSSMYQYAYNDPNSDGVVDNYYANDAYNGDTNLWDGQIAPQKIVVNNLIGEFLASGKQVAAICHAVTVLAWARVDGVSPIAGKNVAVPHTVMTPPQLYNGVWHTDSYNSGQYDQVVDNGGLASPASGIIGNSPTPIDDVVVDGLVITAENYDSSTAFGRILALEILASLPPENHAPVAANADCSIPENTANGSIIGQVAASDPDAGQSLHYAIVGGNELGAFQIDPATGVLRVANSAALNFEQRTAINATVQVSDSGDPSLSTLAQVVVHLTDVAEGPVSRVGNDLVVQGTNAADTIYLWSGAAANTAYAWLNGTSFGPYQLPTGGRVIVYSGNGNDQVYATDLRISARIYGEGGHDLITGGSAADMLDGGDGVDRLWAGLGDDFVRGGDGNDLLYGREGNDILLGDTGTDYLEGFSGNDVLIGGNGVDLLLGGAGEDLLIGGRTSYDSSELSLASILAVWSSPGTFASRLAILTNPVSPIHLIQGDTIHDDHAVDCLLGEAGTDALFANLGDLAVQ